MRTRFGYNPGVHKRLDSFGALSLILLLLVVAMVAVPDSNARVWARNEADAVRALQKIALAQARIRTHGAVDRDRNGRHEFGLLPDLLEDAPDGSPWLELAIEGDPKGESVGIPGYRLAVMLPDGRGLGANPAAPERIVPALAERAFLALAWPLRAGKRNSGLGAYAVDRNLLVVEHWNEDERLTGRELPEGLVGSLPILVENPAAKRFLAPSSWPKPWAVLLRQAQSRWFRAGLQQYGLPVPEGLQEQD